MSLRRVCFVLPDFSGGGAERVMLKVASHFREQGVSVDVVVARALGPLQELMPPEAKLIDLSGRSTSRPLLPMLALIRLSRYLRRQKPDCMISTLTGTNLLAVAARTLSRSPTPVLLREANTWRNLRSLGRRAAVRLLYPRADAIVAVSEGVRGDLVKHVQIPESRVEVITNPVDLSELTARAEEASHHPWLQDTGVPVFLGTGRLERQKGFDVLLRAFAVYRRQHPARLIILGEGGLRRELNDLSTALGIADDVDLPGYIDNPLPYMKRAPVFVLSSRWEGYPNALLEALAAGTSIVATDCHSGPREILRGGELGYLCQVDDHEALARAMTAAIDQPRRVRHPELAATFPNGKRVAQEYFALCQSLKR